METFKLLLVEDDAREIQTFTTTLERYCLENTKDVNPVVVKSLEESISILDNSFDGAIIDIKLNGDDNAGNELLGIISTKFRIPVAVYTGAPDNVDISRIDWKRFQRGVGYDQPLNFLFEIYNTGITRILGGRGEIEQKMDQIFWNNIHKHFENWKSYRVKGKDTEKALLRFIISHITELIDGDVEKYFLEEMYISPVISKSIKTGGIVKKKKSDIYFIILSPACDLALHKGNFKTDRIMVCLIEKLEMSMVRNARKDESIEILATDSEDEKKAKREKIEQGKRTISQLKRNNYSPYFHYLPKTEFFQGGFVNFRKIETFLPGEFAKNFETPLAQISSAFVKDIVARFSSYYARQGQPDFDEHIL